MKFEENFPLMFIKTSRFFLALCPDLATERPQEHESLSNVIIIDNLPKVDPGRLEKLKVVIAKVYNEFGGFRNSYFPTDEEEKTKG